MLKQHNPLLAQSIYSLSGRTEARKRSSKTAEYRPLRAA